eukprot:Opistho-1_new@101194
MLSFYVLRSEIGKKKTTWKKKSTPLAYGRRRVVGIVFADAWRALAAAGTPPSAQCAAFSSCSSYCTVFVRPASRVRGDGDALRARCCLVCAAMAERDRASSGCDERAARAFGGVFCGLA